MNAQQAMGLLTSRGLETREQALAMRVELDVQKWGERERAVSSTLHSKRTHALLLNSIAVHDVDHIDEDLRAAARALMTSDDLSTLRRGG